MRSPAHIGFGLFSGSIVASFYANNLGVEFGMNRLTAASLLVATTGSLFPDIDNRRAPISRALPFLSRFICRRWPHRTVMHSLVGLCISALALFGTLRMTGYAIQYYRGTSLLGIHISLFTSLFTACFLSHLVLDTFTRQGIRWLYPLIHNPFGYPSIEGYRLVTGDRRAEIPVTAISVCLFWWYLPVAQEGADVSLSNAIGKFAQLREVYMRAVNKEVVLEFEGYYESNKSPVAGRGLILSADENYLTILMNSSIHHLGQDEGDIRLLEGRCRLLSFPPIERSTIYRNSKLTDILSDIKGDALVSGHLDASRTYEARRPYDDRTIAVSAKTLALRFARRDDIDALQIAVKEEGIPVPDIQKEIHRKEGLIDSLKSARLGTEDLYKRGFLFTQIAEQRKELKKLSEKLESGEAKEEELLFSGRLSQRVVPPY